MNGLRASWAKVASLAERLSERDKEIIGHLARVRLLTGAQLERLSFTHHSDEHQSHIRRRVLKRLVDLELVGALERPIGGVRAGSAGLIYCLGRMGQRMADLLNGSTPNGRTRSPRTPGDMFLRHTLAISETFVSLVELSRQTATKLRTFHTEPNCWWPDGHGGFLRPDGLVIVEDDNYDATSWLEIDQGSEHLGRIRAKIAAYERFAMTGTEGANGVLPHVVFATPGDSRADAIAREIANQGTLRMTYRVTTQEKLAATLFRELESS
ncbi:replication-relaxation family protein [Amycolatopsis sp. H20-H5]|uniref:replication-relaxation family protein n=1 Tax=Amycolatopsis sp. H20-H5 TaxID=3046309 RepID=UPI002DBA7756|nr:replication-relaxation family protein [Amycolatopsis sp. H20-H5]MEC3980402.1 replication-relaxation family protein [Amycolatopsis sp. H20-H5]